MLDRLVTTIAQVRERAEAHESLLTKNELLTRYALIDPLLRALGWPVDDPAWVQVELQTAGGGRADYVLLDGVGRVLVVLEAKALGGKLDLAGSAAIGYAWALHHQGQPPRLVGLSDGLRWVLAEPHHLKQPLYQIDLGGKTPLPELALLIARALWRELWCETKSPTASEVPVPALSPAAKAWQTRRASQLVTTATTVAGSPEARIVPLSQFVGVPGTAPPAALVFPDGKEYPLSSWRDFLVRTVEWLIDSGRFDEARVPIPRTDNPNGRFVVHRERVHGSGKPFEAPVQVRGRCWVEAFVGAPEAPRDARRVLQAFGVAPETVLVRLHG